MEFDFGNEYRSKSDADLMLLSTDIESLVPMAKEALLAELANRQLTTESYKTHPALIDNKNAYEEEETVFPNSYDLSFPEICPRCAKPANSKNSLRISSGSDFYTRHFVPVSIWRFLFKRYKVPFCRECAKSISVRRWFVRSVYLVSIILVTTVMIRFHLTNFAYLLLFGPFLLAYGLWIYKFKKLWPGEGVEVVSAPHTLPVRLVFSHDAYKAAFLDLNRERRLVP